MQDGRGLVGGSGSGGGRHSMQAVTPLSETDGQMKTADCISWPIKSSSAYQTEASPSISAP